MKVRSLRTRFILSGCILLAATVGCGAWSVVNFARLGAAVDNTLGETQETLKLADDLAKALEREDDALLLSLSGFGQRATEDLRAQRGHFSEAYARLQRRMDTEEEKEAFAALRTHADAYRGDGDALLAAIGKPGADRAYHERVNPALRKAVADCVRIRDLKFATWQRAGIEARSVAARSSLVVTVIAVAALLLSAGVVTFLSYSVLRPIRELDRAVEAIRRDKLDCRVKVSSTDEFGRLANGFNPIVPKSGCALSVVQSRTSVRSFGHFT